MSTDERALREDDLRRFVREPFLAQFDRDFHAEFGRWPADSPSVGSPPPAPAARTVSPHLREAVQALIDRGATEGEREAARAAMHRLEHPSEQAHAATERGSYYARDTLAGTSGDE